MMRNITYVGWGLGFWQTVSGDIRHDSRSVISEKQPVNYIHLYIHMCVYIYIHICHVGVYQHNREPCSPLMFPISP